MQRIITLRALLFALGILVWTCTSILASVTVLSGPGDFAGPATTINFDQDPEGTPTNSLYVAQGVQFYTDGATVPIRTAYGYGVQRISVGWMVISRQRAADMQRISTRRSVVARRASPASVIAVCFRRLFVS